MTRIQALLECLSIFLLANSSVSHGFVSFGLLTPSPTPTHLFSASTRSSSSSHQFWREVADPKEHRDYMIPRYPGGQPVEAPRDNLHQHYVYFVRLDSGFVFSLQGMSQVRQCRDYFSRKVRPSTKKARWYSERDHGCGPWHCRLPKGITDSKRQRILKRLDELVALYGDDYDFVYNQRMQGHQGFEDRTAWIEENKKQRATYRYNLRQELLADAADLPDLVWTAIGKEVWPQSALNNAEETRKKLAQAIHTTTKVLNKMPPPPADQTPLPKKDPPRLSKFRRKRLEKQRQKDKEMLEEIGRPTLRIDRALEDTLEEMVGNQSSSGEELLTELRGHKKQVHRVAKDIGDRLFSIKYGN